MMGRHEPEGFRHLFCRAWPHDARGMSTRIVRGIVEEPGNQIPVVFEQGHPTIDYFLSTAAFDVASA